MTFEEVLDQEIVLLQRSGRVIYRTLQRESGPLPGKRLDDLCPEPFKIRETGCEVVR